jgi:hypothetical protein
VPNVRLIGSERRACFWSLVPGETPRSRLGLWNPKNTSYGCGPLPEGLAMAVVQHRECIDWEAVVRVVCGFVAGSALWGFLG